jgi:hypothetical protein
MSADSWPQLRWWVSSWQRETNVHVIACFATADRAKISDELKEDEAVDKALRELAALLGKDASQLRAKYDNFLSC